MPNVVDRFGARMPRECQVKRCRKQGCTLDMGGAPGPYVLIDMDCPQLRLSPNQRKCDYLFVGQD